MGEIRDRETAEIAIQASLTGHLVFSTLHTNDAASAVTRLLDMGIEPFLIASSVLAILAQRLVRLICPACRAATVPAQEIVRDLSRTAEFWIRDGGQFARGAGCATCGGSGYRGRTGIYELLPLDDGLRELIMQRANANMLKAAGIKAGMRTLLQSGSQKVLAGLTTAEEVLRVTQDSVHAERQLSEL